MPGPLTPDTLQAAIVRALDGGMRLSDSASPSGEPPSRSHTPMHLALGVMGGGQLADALSTKAALERGGGSTEANPLLGSDPSLARVLGTKAAVMGPLALLLDKLYNAHPKFAAGAAVGIGGLGMGLAAHNAQVKR
jgi:hypothetical protein